MIIHVFYIVSLIQVSFCGPIKSKITAFEENFLLKDHGHSDEKHGHSESIESHEIMRRDTEDIIKKAMEDSAKEIHDLEMELDEAIDLETASADRVELKPDEEAKETMEAAAAASRVEEEANQAMEAKLIADGDQAFQEFDKDINEAIKQNEAVEEEVRKDIDEQSEHKVDDV